MISQAMTRRAKRRKNAKPLMMLAEPLERRALLTAIANGQEILDFIPAAGSESFEFSVVDGETVRVSVGETSGNGFVAEPFVQVFDPGDNLVGSDGGSTSSDQAEFQFEASQTGTYRAVVSDHGGTDPLNFRLRVVALPGSTAPTLIAGRDKALSNGEEFQGTVPIGTFNLFQFSATDGETVRVSVGETVGNGFVAEPFVEVFAPTGESLGFDGGSTSSDEAEFQFGATATGTYTAIVRDHGGGDVLNFRVRVASLPGATPPGLIAGRDKALANGEEFEGTVLVGTFNLFQFEATDGGTVRVSVGEMDGAGFTAEPFVEVFDPTGMSIGFNGGSTSSDEAEFQFGATTTGTYTAIVRDDGGGDVLNFRVRVASLPGATPPTLIADRDKALSNGEEFEGTVPVGTFSLFPFEVTDGETVRVSVGETVGNGFVAEPFVEVFAPTGESLGFDGGSTSSDEAELQFGATATGTYTAIVRDDGGGDVLNFRVRVASLPGATAPGLIAGRDKALANGEEFEGTVPVGTFNLFQFEATDGETVRVSVGEMDGAGFTAEPFVEVFDPTGTSVGTDGGSTSSNEASFQFPATMDGPYTAIVRDSGGGDILHFRVRVAALPGTAPPALIVGRDKMLDNGEEFEAVVPVGAFNMFQFGAVVGEQVRVSIDELSGNSFVAEPFVEIIDPTGASIGVDGGSTSSNDAEVVFAATGDGVYTAIVRDAGGGDLLDFRVSLDKGSIFVDDGTLYLRGTEQADSVLITETGGAAVVSLNGDERTFSTASFSSWNVDLRAGDDALDAASVTMPMVVLARSGNDTLTSGSGADTMYGHAGDDLLDGGEGNDVLVGAGGADTVHGGAHDDRLRGGGGPDLLDGSSGADRLGAGSGADTLLGGSADDNLNAGPGPDQVDGGSGNDTLYGRAGHDVLLGGPGNDEIQGLTGRDFLVGGDGEDTIRGNGDDDVTIAGTISPTGGVSVMSYLLDGIRNEWLSKRDYAQRVENIRDGAGAGSKRKNETFLIGSGRAGQTVFDDSAADSLVGGNQLDAFFAASTLELADKGVDEFLEII